MLTSIDKGSSRNVHIYVCTHICIHIYTYIYIFLLTKFLFNIYNMICDITVHSFFCWHVTPLQLWTS